MPDLRCEIICLCSGVTEAFLRAVQRTAFFYNRIVTIHLTYTLFSVCYLRKRVNVLKRVPLTSLIPIDLVIIDFNLHATLQKIVVFRVIDFKGDRCPA